MDLTDALALGEREVVAFVGGGGKTTAMYRLCREAAARGRRALASGTARFTLPPGRLTVPLIVHRDGAAVVTSVRERLSGSGWVIAAFGESTKERLLPVDAATVQALATDGLDLVALEADGSAMRPFKAPAQHEPAVPPSATLVVAVVGADVFGRPLDDAFVHRPERVCRLSGAAPDAPVTPEVVAAVLAHAEGGRKAVPAGARFAVLINKVSDARERAARDTAERLIAAGVERVVLGRVREEPPVVDVLVAGVRSRA